MKEASDALYHARKINPDSKFVASCRNFYYDRGYLTEKQINALWNISDPEEQEYHMDPLWDFGDR